MTYLTQWLEYCFHTAGVIGSNPIVGRPYKIPESMVSNKFFYSTSFIDFVPFPSYSNGRFSLFSKEIENLFVAL